jgi:hypothetical protein
MLTLIWKPAEFHVVDIPPKGAKFRSAYHLSHFMDPMLAGLQPEWWHPFRKLVIHADEAGGLMSKMVD